MGGFFRFDMFSIMTAIFPLFFLLIFGVILFTIIRGIKEWNTNNKQPVLTVVARLVSKRTNVSRHHNSNNNIHSTTSTTYYGTFEVESGDRMEFAIKGKEYGMLAEGDLGKLRFQGSRYHSFERVNTVE